jgi:hypothetical protein
MSLINNLYDKMKKCRRNLVQTTLEGSISGIAILFAILYLKKTTVSNEYITCMSLHDVDAHSKPL